MTDQPDIDAVRNYLLDLQDRLCAGLTNAHWRKVFREDRWTRPGGGGGCSRIIEDDPVFEKGGINYSEVKGDALPSSATANRDELVGRGFRAMGVSLVMHPHNPFVPTSHMNVRFFLAEKPAHPPVWWFGGGLDLTPYYGNDDDVIHWHRTARAACTGFGDNDGADLHARLKTWCDRYFFLPHRNEPRGVGGLFFDDVDEWGFARSFAFMRSVAEHFLPGYLPIVARRKDHPYGQAERAFQKYRRGRYVEFNLVYDRGTLFGLQSRGRAESILMSLPPEVSWRYDWQPDPGSAEAELYTRYLVPRDWAQY